MLFDILKDKYVSNDFSRMSTEQLKEIKLSLVMSLSCRGNSNIGMSYYYIKRIEEIDNELKRRGA